MRVNEIFYSIQGEGAHSGEAAIFIRLSGCNLKCSFCDTKHQSFQNLSEEEICAEISEYPANLVVITGGEPALQLTHSLVDKIHRLNKKVAVETNGTRKLPANVDWITVSPKEAYVSLAGKIVTNTANEVKIVLDGKTLYADPTWGIVAEHYYVQPCDTGNEQQNREIINHCINFVKANPKWKLSLQTQKILKVQ